MSFTNGGENKIKHHYQDGGAFLSGAKSPCLAKPGRESAAYARRFFSLYLIA